MEKTKNGWYQAVSILLYIGAGLFTIGVILMLIGGLARGEQVAEVLNQAKMTDENGNVLVFTAEYVKNVVLSTSMFMLPSIVIMFIEAVMFGKYVYMNGQEAVATYKSAVTWTVVSFFFGGTLIGILALVGLLKIHAVQKERYLAGVAGAANQNVQGQEESAEATAMEKVETADDIDKMQERLKRLENLKAAGAITEEEYKTLRDKIINK